jgi:hypothetical protein
MLDVDMIKEYIKDKPELNILYDNIEQFSDDLMDIVIPMTYSEASVIAPSIAKNPSLVPDVIILHGVIARLMESESFLELRNQLQYQDNNMSSMPLSAKQSQYTQLSQMMRQYFLQLLNAWATTEFYQNAWGHTFSNSMDMENLYAGYFTIGFDIINV